MLLEEAIAADEAEEMRALSLELAEKDLNEGRDYTYLDGAQRVWNLVDKGEVFERAVQHPRVMEAMQYLLGEDFTLSSFTTNIIGSGTPDGRLHIDTPLSALPTPRPSFPLIANSVWFLDDFTLENGATRIVPGSHLRLEDGPEPEVEYDEMQVTGPKGTVMIINGALWHASAANRTERQRICLLGFFCRAVLKPQQNQLDLVSREVVERATPKLKQLLGCDSMPQMLR